MLIIIIIIIVIIIISLAKQSLLMAWNVYAFVRLSACQLYLLPLPVTYPL